MPPAVPDVTVVTVSFNTAAVLKAAMTALVASTGVSLEIIVVDNASSDDSAALIEAEFPAIRLIRNADNRGFAAATNQGLAIARGRYLLLLNPDTVVPPQAIAQMVTFMDAHPAVGICGPRLLLGDGTVQSCGRPFPTVRSVLRQTRTIDRLARAVGSDIRDEASHATPTPCDWVEGACLLIRRATFEAIGPLDERFFLFCEEMDWCQSGHERGWPVYALPQIEITHLRGESTRQRELESTAWLVQMTLMYFHKRRGLAVAMFVALAMTAGFVRQLFVERPLACAKLRGVSRWLAGVPQQKNRQLN